MLRRLFSIVGGLIDSFNQILKSSRSFVSSSSSPPQSSIAAKNINLREMDDKIFYAGSVVQWHNSAPTQNYSPAQQTEMSEQNIKFCFDKEKVLQCRDEECCFGSLNILCHWHFIAFLPGCALATFHLEELKYVVFISIYLIAHHVLLDNRNFQDFVLVSK